MQELTKYFSNVFAPSRRRFACYANDPSEFRVWQRSASAVLRQMLGLDTIASQVSGFASKVSEYETEDCGQYFRQKVFIDTEPGITIPVWILRPKSTGPHPLAITPHGHTHFGADQYVGIAKDDVSRRLIESEERDVAVQAVNRGYITLAPVTRGFAPVTIPDETDHHGGSLCRSQLMRALLAGRTALGERLWDLLRVLDWGFTLQMVDRDRVLALGNSGGCVLTALLAACDDRITVSVMNCCFCTFVSATGSFNLCDCNTIPGMMEFGDFPDVAGLIAPRPLLVINGISDIHPHADVATAVAALKRIYGSSGHPENMKHVYADGGCRFYKNIMWPFVDEAFTASRAAAVQSAAEQKITLRSVDERNVRLICDLSVSPEQAVLVAPNAVTIAQAAVCRNAQCHAIYADEMPVGLIMVAEEDQGRFYLWRFMIGAKYQRRGFGGRAIDILIHRLSSLPEARELYLTYVPLVGNAREFYISHGFEDLSESRGTDKILRRSLNT